MGLFSRLFKAITQPVVNTVSFADDSVQHVTQNIDKTVAAVGHVLAPVPVIGAIADEFVFQSNLATDVANSVSALADTTAGLTQAVGGAILDLDGALAGEGVSIEVSQITDALGTGLDATVASITSIFDFG